MHRSSFAFFLYIGLFMTCLSAQIHADNQPGWTGSWYSPPQAWKSLFADGTVRTVVRITVGGDRLRLRFSNLYGHAPLKIGAVHVKGVASGQDAMFKGRSQITLGPGMYAISDPVNLETQPHEKLVISVFYPEAIPREVTAQAGTSEGDTLTPGNAVHDLALASTTKSLDATYFLTGVDVENVAARGAIVVVGDGYIDFERAVADSARPDHLRPEFDFHAHPNEAGQRALSEFIDLSKFE
jgi:hypothetical protein